MVACWGYFPPVFNKTRRPTQQKGTSLSLEPSHSSSYSPLEEKIVHGRRLYVKRDDLIVHGIPGLSGNKVRKLQGLLASPSRRDIISCGGAQGNTMAALAALCSAKKRRFMYYTRTLPAYLRENPTGNLRFALEKGMQLRELDNNTFRSLDLSSLPEASSSMIVPQGASYPEAELGVSKLAKELYDQINELNLGCCTIAVASGTGTLALFLQRHLVQLGSCHQVLALPIVGDDMYLLKQMKGLDERSGCIRSFPEILKPKAIYPFAKERSELLDVWKETSSAGIEVDLIYGARAWEMLFEQTGSWLYKRDRECIYYNCGGLEGNKSQLMRYRRAGMLG